mgnify:CR=1 FL=1
MVDTAQCQEVVITGDDLRKPGGGLARTMVQHRAGDERHGRRAEQSEQDVEDAA